MYRTLSPLRYSLFLISVVFFNSVLFSQKEYEKGPNSDTYGDIPKGTVTKHTWKSTIFPNTNRDYYVYVPEQYTAGQTAALMIFQDGHTYVKKDGDFEVPVVFDNMIAQGKMPVTIGLFIDPGHSIDSVQAATPWKSSNRSFEYDEISDRYGKFLLEEMIPELRKKYAISDRPEMRAIGGISSGGICAFTAAWFFPDQFGKVMSHIGSFTNIRGGHAYPSMIRKNDKKNIKVFLQDGNNDLNNVYGNWWLANLQMESALKFKEYNYRFIAGEGGHNGNHAGAILPESLTWLWGDVVENRVAEGVYTISPEKKDTPILAGETAHLSSMDIKLKHLTSSSSALTVKKSEKEHLYIVKKGELRFTVNGKSSTLGANSVVVLLPGDELKVDCLSSNASYYVMEYTSKEGVDHKQGKKGGGSSRIDYQSIPFQAHDKGGIRKYFNRSTAMCPYYEMHITNLNPGIKSHEPHIHEAAEIVLMIDGSTEMQIGNSLYEGKAGDLYYLPSNVPHAIKNIGESQAQYFAFQWY
ncbi:cupin domain-containing protein [Pareuzebyella sediminis]|uniref:cupin domain-containing protein n=1 Tax=Pareuzebyella sediminis TaxID=2607998 RepID=UPI0011ED361F|nr:cupin domain-containing protein [Pareuzebyella sediminis]